MLNITLKREKRFGLMVVAVYVNDVRATEFLSEQLARTWVSKHFSQAIWK